MASDQRKPQTYRKDFQAGLTFQSGLGAERHHIWMRKSPWLLVVLCVLTIVAPFAEGVAHWTLWPSIALGIVLNVSAAVLGYFAVTRNIQVDHFTA